MVEKLGNMNVIYLHDLIEHGYVFLAIVVITHVGINGGKRLFVVDYSDE